MFKINPKISTDNAAPESKTEAAKNTQTTNLFPEPENGKSVKGITVKKSSATAPSIDKDKAQEYANSLYEAMKGLGADKDAVEEIILNENLNSYDIVSIMDRYGCTNRGHFLEKDFAANFMGKSEDKLLQRILDASFEVMADDAKTNCHLNKVADLALARKTLENFMIEKGMIEKDTESANISVSTMVTGVRG